MPAQAIGDIATLANKRPHPLVELIAQHRAKQLDAGVLGFHGLGIGAKALVVPGRAKCRLARAPTVQIRLVADLPKARAIFLLDISVAYACRSLLGRTAAQPYLHDH